MKCFCRHDGTDGQYLDTARRCLLAAFILSIFLFPFGQAFRVGIPPLCLPPLLYLYVKGWSSSTLARLPLRWLFLLFFGCITLQIVFAIHPGSSFRVVSPNFLRALILPFAGMECARSEKDLRFLVIAFVAAGVLEGLDGVWQLHTGYDFLRRAPLVSGRLTASFGGYRVGDYMGIILLPSLALPCILAKRLGSRALCLLLLSPAFILLVFAQSRMGYLALAGGGWLLYVLAFQRLNWKTLLLPLGLFALALFFGPERVRLEQFLESPRFQMWTVAWKTFLHTPWLGTGAGSFEPALEAAGFSGYDATPEGPGFMHPHNAYLQFLIDGGIVSFTGMLVFFGTFSLWALSAIRRGIQKERSGLHWRLSAFFWASWIGYLIVLAGGHGFYRTWFLAVGMTMLGITIGAVVNGPGSAGILCPEASEQK